MEAETKFLGYRHGAAVFRLHCQCGTTGQISVLERDRNRLVPCPARCGVQYIERRGRGFFAQPSLELAIAASQATAGRERRQA